MNPQNLIPNSQRTHEQLVEMGRKGGIASGVRRRKQRDLKKHTAKLLKAMYRYERKTGRDLLTDCGLTTERLYVMANGKHSRRGRPSKSGL